MASKLVTNGKHHVINKVERTGQAKRSGLTAKKVVEH